LRLVSATLREELIRGATLFLLGALGAAVGYVFFPNWIFTSIAPGDHHGPLLWPAGLAIAAAGACRLAVALKPPLGVWCRRHRAILVVVGALAVLGLTAAAWR